MTKKMFFKQMSVDNWSGVINTEKEINTFSFDEVYEYIRNLDGNTKTLVTLEGYNNECMGIGGGPDLFIVYVTLDNDNIYTLLNETKSDKLIALKTGGQYGEYQEKYCNAIEDVLKVVDTFIIYGKLNTDYQWDYDN
jgi:hypothetical protein